MPSDDRTGRPIEAWIDTVANERWDEYVAENSCPTPREPLDDASVYELMERTMIQCHGGGSTHAASICLQCERFVSCEVDGGTRSLTVRCWWQRPQPRLARGSGLFEVPLLCASCGADEGVSAHPRMENVPICSSCLDVSRRGPGEGDLGGG